MFESGQQILCCKIYDHLWPPDLMISD